MTEYYAVNPQDPNDRIPLDSTTREEAEEEMEDMQNFHLKPIFPKLPGQHVFDIAFQLESYYTSDDIPIDELRHALLKRICELDHQLVERKQTEWKEAVGLVDSSDIDFEPKNEKYFLKQIISKKGLEDNINNLKTLSELNPPPSEIGKSIREVQGILEQILDCSF